MALTAQGRRRPIPQQEKRSPKLICLPEPPQLIATLQPYALDTETLQRINEAYIKRAHELQDTTAAAIAQASTALSPMPGLSPAPSNEKVTAIFTQVYLNTLRRWIKDIETTVSSRTSGAVLEGKSKPFNYDYIPLLEHFFNENPFPSHADKAFLAKKSGMTYRQIHVWFQNRRSRTKKEGRRLHKTPSARSTLRPIPSSCTGMERYISEMDEPPHAARARTSSSDCFSAPCTSIGNNSLDCQAPPHAFPTPYPPSCSYEPFSAKSLSFSYHWMRSPSTTIRETSLDIDALADLFSQLNIKDCRAGTTQNFGSRKFSSATSAFTTRPSPAPLPSFISSESRPPLKRYPPLPAIPAPRWRRRVFDSPPEAQPLTLVPSTALNTGRSVISIMSPRKIAPLPRRIPQSVDSVYRPVSPLSDASTFSSESSPRSVSSSSNITYTCSDILYTPHHMISVH